MHETSAPPPQLPAPSAEPVSLHPSVFRDSGKWYFWCADRNSFDGPFATDALASHAAYAYDLDRETERGRQILEERSEELKVALWNLSTMCRALNDTWWRDPDTLAPLEDRNRGELIALMHSELSEALEGMRRNRMDDHLPHRKQVEVELADLLIRVFDFVGETLRPNCAEGDGQAIDLGGALVEKCRYNLIRNDHRAESRTAGSGGKLF